MKMQVYLNYNLPFKFPGPTETLYEIHIGWVHGHRVFLEETKTNTDRHTNTLLLLYKN